MPPRVLIRMSLYEAFGEAGAMKSSSSSSSPLLTSRNAVGSCMSKAQPLHQTVFIPSPTWKLETIVSKMRKEESEEASPVEILQHPNIDIVIEEDEGEETEPNNNSKSSDDHDDGVREKEEEPGR